MRLLLDQDVYAGTSLFPGSLGHDVVTAAELGLSRASDIDLLDTAKDRQRILITRDRHFGSLVFLRKLGTGVIYLRLTPSDASEVHSELARVLDNHPEEELRLAFVVVEQGRHRFRRLPY